MTCERTRVPYDMGKWYFSYRGYSYSQIYMYQKCDEGVETIFILYLPKAVKIQDSFKEFKARFEEKKDA